MTSTSIGLGLQAGFRAGLLSVFVTVPASVWGIDGMPATGLSPQITAFSSPVPVGDGSFYALTNNAVVHADKNGSLLTDLTNPFKATSGLSALSIDASGNIFVGGYFSFDGSTFTSVAKLHSNGTSYTSFAAVLPNISYDDDNVSASEFPGLAADNQGGCFIAGSFDTLNGKPATGIAHVNPSGTVSNVARPSGLPTGSAPFFIARTGDGLIVVENKAIYKILDSGGSVVFDTAGTRWSTVDRAAYNSTYGLVVAVHPNNAEICIAYSASGTVNQTFSSSVQFLNVPGALSWDAVGRVLVSSTQLLENSSNPYGIKRLLNNGSIDPNWSRFLVFDGVENALVPLSDVVLVSGAFTHVDGLSANHITQLNASDTAAIVTNQSVMGTINGGVSPFTLGTVISGNFVKEALIRAVGPSLKNYGVTQVPSQTLLRIFGANGVLIQSVTPSAATDDQLALSGEVGAFPLVSSGVYEAEIVVDLVPGAYTIQLDAPLGQSGQILGEIYFP